MFDEEGLEKGKQRYGALQNVGFSDEGLQDECDCGHVGSDHSAKGDGEACDKCGCGMFHGVGKDDSKGPQAQ